MEAIQSEKILEMIASASNNLQNNKKHINDLNVFPVPDGDTGTNMSMTFGAAAAAVSKTDTSCGAYELLDSLARASLRSARGNSGVILSQILRGLASGVHARTELGIADIKSAVCESRDTAYRAVMKPTEGTILTVVRETAEFAEAEYENYSDVQTFIGDLLAAAKASLDKTPEILPVLKQAGVVDAGGMGIVTLLEGAAAALSGSPVELDQGVEAVVNTVKTDNIDTANIKYLYCTEFLIQKSPERQAVQFKAAIQSKGDCMLVIEDEDIVKVHIHTNHPGFVIEQALKLGELTNLKIDNMKYQHNERLEAEEKTELKKYGFVAVSAGAGLNQVFDSLDVDIIVEGGQTMNPSTQDLLDAVNKISAENIFVLPNNKNIILAAEQVNDLTDKNVIVIPTKNIPQGISAVLAFDEDAEPEDNKTAMEEMISAVQCGQVTFAARDSLIDGFDIHKDDIMGMINGDIKGIGQDINTVAAELVSAMVNDDCGVISIYYGADTDEKQAEELKRTLEDKYNDLDVSLVYGGQPVYYYFLAVE